MSFQSRSGLLLISLVKISMLVDALLFKVPRKFLLPIAGFLRLKIDERNKRPLQISGPLRIIISAPSRLRKLNKHPGR